MLESQHSKKKNNDRKTSILPSSCPVQRNRPRAKYLRDKNTRAKADTGAFKSCSRWTISMGRHSEHHYGKQWPRSIVGHRLELHCTLIKRVTWDCPHSSLSCEILKCIHHNVYYVREGSPPVADLWIKSKEHIQNPRRITDRKTRIQGFLLQQCVYKGFILAINNWKRD